MTNNFLTYENQTYGIKIKYPYDWNLIGYNTTNKRIYEEIPIVTFFMNDIIVNNSYTEPAKLIKFPASLTIAISDWYDSDDPINGSIVDAINTRINFYENFKLNGLNSNVSIENKTAYQISYSIKTIDGDYLITDYFIKRDHRLYIISFEQTLDCIPCFDDFEKIKQVFLKSFEISYAKIDLPIPIIDGKIEKDEWDNAGSVSLKLLLLNRTNLLSSINKPESITTNNYTITLAAKGDDKNIYLLVGLISPSNLNFRENRTLTVDLYPNKLNTVNDSIIIHSNFKDSKRKDIFFDGYRNTDVSYDGFVNKDNILTDISMGGTTDGSIEIFPHPNRTDILEISHPLCSNDKKWDFCILPETPLDLYIGINTTADNFKSGMFPNQHYSEIGFSVKDGLFVSSFAFSRALTLVTPTNFILDILAKLSIEKRSEFLNNLTTDELHELLTRPTDKQLTIFLKSLSSDKLEEFLTNLSENELKAISSSISKNDLNQILKHLKNSVLVDKMKLQ